MKILTLGDCNTLGMELLQSSAYTFPYKLISFMQDDGFDVELLNLGMTMSTTREGVTLMKDQGVQYAADLIIINYGLVDCWVTTIPSIYVPYYPDSPGRKRRRKLLKSLKRRLRRPLLLRFVPTGYVVSPDEFSKNLTEMANLARNKNSGVDIIFWGSMPVREDATRNESLILYNAVLKEVASKVGGYYLDASSLFNEDEEKSLWYLDEVHLTAEVHGRIAQGMQALWLVIKGADT